MLRSPALREETPPTRPAANAVWTAGFWQWDESSWVWVKGSRQLPPQPAATSRPAEWRIEASGAVFVPGGWSLRLGP
ncbi:MAG: YXWGXW repeat-containing protein [Deltaproteobacteria bacterium]|nr:YXWGXW repeat-containing protein [Deltaproteobacteria bacterium]